MSQAALCVRATASALRLIVASAVAFAAVGCGGGGDFKTTGKKLTIIGIDGMDPKLTRQFMELGLMPNFKALSEEGGLHNLGTSNPPQSPVAWSNFIIGENPGGHGVIDFLHRDPRNRMPMSSTQTAPEASGFEIGSYIFPSPFAESPERIQQGTPFWVHLEDAGVKADIFRIPAAYPLEPATSQLVLSDMGTPDLMGGIDGVYSYFTSTLMADRDRISAGQVAQVSVDDNVVRASLKGPPKPFSAAGDQSETPFKVYLDPVNPTAYIEFDDAPGITIEEGVWSDWTEVSFDLGLGQSASGIVHFYLQEARPNFRLYVSPINIDPLAPASPISLPDDDAVIDLAEKIGRFYTQGLAEETKALQERVLTDEEFLKQCDFITDERMRMLDYALNRFDDGLMFFYFSSIDLRCHMMYRHITPGHPAADPEGTAVQDALKRQHAIRSAYERMDQALGVIRDRIGHDSPILVMSDHGFQPFTRNVHLNRWLYNEGYLVLDEDGEEMVEKGEGSLAAIKGIDWEKTRAYAVGFNAIYINRENDIVAETGESVAGPVKAGEVEDLCAELKRKLEAVTDPQRDGANPIKCVYRATEIYDGRAMANAPDLVIGYDAHYGASDDTALGGFPMDFTEVLEDNQSYWSGNHLMDPSVVPGVLCTNLKVQKSDPNLCDLHATVLDFFDVEIPETCKGSPVFQPTGS